MRVAIDATSIPKKPVGVGNYLINLVRSLSNLALEEEILVFTHHSTAPLFRAPTNPQVKTVPLRDKSPALRLLWEQTGLPLLLRRYRVNLLHSPHYTIPLLAQCKRVVTVHDLTFFLYPQVHQAAKRIFFRTMTTLSNRYAEVVITISENTRQDLLRLLHTPPNKVITVPLGVGAEFELIQDSLILSRVKQKYQLPERFFLYVGTLEPRKNIAVLLDAFQRYCQMDGDASLVLVGQKGWMLDDLIGELHRSTAGSRVRWLEYVPQEDLPAIYNLALALIYPTLYEGFGLPPLEAMACGTPVISSDVGAIRELVGQAALLFTPSDAEGFTRGMTAVAGDLALRRTLREQGLQRASLYSWEKTAQQTLEIYRQVCSGGA